MELFLSLILLFILFIGGGFYLLPTIIAIIRKHHQKTAIIVLNVLLGATGIGWAIALIWALTAVRRETNQ